MCDGHIVYQGKAKESEKYFRSIGYKMSLYENPADYYLKVLTINYPKEKSDEDKISHLYTSYKELIQDKVDQEMKLHSYDATIF